MENLTIDCSSDETLTSLKKFITATKNIIIGEIQDLARNDDKEFSRIKCVWARADFLQLPKDLHEKFFTDSELALLNEFKDIEPSIKEIYLSMALNLCQQASKTRFCNGAGLSIFWLMRANEFIGRAKGYDEGKEISDEKTKAIKQQIYKKASDIRHQGNREMKEQAIKYYKENIESFTSKDDAAFEMSIKNIPASFSTIRGWLKNI